MNAPSPETTTPATRYRCLRQERDWDQRQFAWDWRLEYVSPDGLPLR